MVILNQNKLNIYEMYTIIQMLENKELTLDSANKLMEKLSYEDRFGYINNRFVKVNQKQKTADVQAVILRFVIHFLHENVYFGLLLAEESNLNISVLFLERDLTDVVILNLTINEKCSKIDFRPSYILIIHQKRQFFNIRLHIV